MLGKFLGSIDKRVLGWLLGLAVFGYFGYTQVDETSKDETVRSESGEVVEGGEVGVFALQVGDCVRSTSETQTSGDSAINLQSEIVVPCTELHHAEIIGKRELTITEFPGTDELLGTHSEFCFDEYVAYTGAPYDESSPHLVGSYVPDSVSWSQGERIITCYAEMYDGSLLGASIRS